MTDDREPLAYSGAALSDRRPEICDGMPVLATKGRCCHACQRPHLHSCERAPLLQSGTIMVNHCHHSAAPSQPTWQTCMQQMQPKAYCTLFKTQHRAVPILNSSLGAAPRVLDVDKSHCARPPARAGYDRGACEGSPCRRSSALRYCGSMQKQPAKGAPVSHTTSAL